MDKIVKTEEDSYIIDGVKNRNRFRYKFQILIPLKKFKTEQKLNIVLYDEAFLDLGNGLRPQELDQNQMFIGFIFDTGKHITIRSGYHDIYVKRADDFINNRVWETTITYKI